MLPRSESYGVFVVMTVLVLGLVTFQMSRSVSSVCFEEAVANGTPPRLTDSCFEILGGWEATEESSEAAPTATEARAAHLMFVALMSLAVAVAVGGGCMAVHLATEPARSFKRRTWGQRCEPAPRLVGTGDFGVGGLAAASGVTAIVGALLWNPTAFTIGWNPYGWNHHLTQLLALLIGPSAISVAVIVAIGHNVAHSDTLELRHLLNARWASARLLAVFGATLSLGILAMTARWRMGEFLPGGESVPTIVALLYGALFSLVLAALAFPTQSRLNSARNAWINSRSGGTGDAFTLEQAQARKAIREELALEWGGSSLLPSQVSIVGPVATAAVTAFFG